MDDQKDNLNPHKAAVVAMWLFGERYAAQNGGSMDFWKALPEPDKRLCRRFLAAIKMARPYTGIQIG